MRNNGEAKVKRERGRRRDLNRPSMTGGVFWAGARKETRRRRNFKDGCSRTRNTREPLIIATGVSLFRGARAAADSAAVPLQPPPLPRPLYFSLHNALQQRSTGYRYEAPLTLTDPSAYLSFSYPPLALRKITLRIDQFVFHNTRNALTGRH